MGKSNTTKVKEEQIKVEGFNEGFEAGQQFLKEKRRNGWKKFGKVSLSVVSAAAILITLYHYKVGQRAVNGFKGFFENPDLDKTMSDAMNEPNTLTTEAPYEVASTPEVIAKVEATPEVPVITETPEVVESENEFVDMFNGNSATREEIEERAQLIYDLDVAPMLVDLDGVASPYANVEGLEDIIAVSLGQLPVNREYDPATAGEVVQSRMEILGNYSSNSKSGKQYETHYALMAAPGSVLYDHMNAYDELYNKVVRARNTGDWDAAIEGIKGIATKVFDQYIRGGNGDIDPDDFADDIELLAYCAAMDRLANIMEVIIQYEMQTGQPLCVDGCLDSETGEKKLVPVLEIFSTVQTGKAGKYVTESIFSSQEEPDSVRMFQAMQDSLAFQYAQSQGKSLTLG